MRQPNTLIHFPVILKPLASIAATLLGIGSALAATDLWDLPPLRYSETAPARNPTAANCHGNPRN
jgi:hypothetical protein